MCRPAHVCSDFLSFRRRESWDLPFSSLHSSTCIQQLIQIRPMYRRVYTGDVGAVSPLKLAISPRTIKQLGDWTIDRFADRIVSIPAVVN